MKIVFLDFDGVLNRNGAGIADNDLVINLKKLLDQTQAKIIFIARARDYLPTVGALVYEIFPRNGLSDEYIYKIPYNKCIQYNEENPRDIYYYNNLKGKYIQMPEIPKEVFDKVDIVKYFLSIEKISQYVVIDDQDKIGNGPSFRENFGNNFIQTNECKGLTEDDVQKAINVLMRPPIVQGKCFT